MLIKLYIFKINKISKIDPNNTCLVVISQDSALKKDKISYPQAFLSECKYIEKKAVRQIDNNFIDFYFSDESDKEQIEAIKFMIF